MLPQVRPGTLLLRRSDGSVQVGTDADGALVVHPDAATTALLSLADGARTAAWLIEAATSTGPNAEEVGRSLRQLLSAGVLADRRPIADLLADTEPSHRAGLELEWESELPRRGPALAAAVLAMRRSSRVTVEGSGRVGGLLGAILAGSGVGDVQVLDDEPVTGRDYLPGGVARRHVGRRAGAVAQEAVDASVILPRPRQPVRVSEPPTAVVLLGRRAMDPSRRAALREQAIPHLVVGMRDSTLVIGPAVLPGRTACLDCLDHGRTDRDPDWPVLAAQLSGRTPPVRPGTVTAVLGAAVAAGELLALLDHVATLEGRLTPPSMADPGGADDALPLPYTVNGTLEVTPADTMVRRRSWSPHPRCVCQQQPPEPTPPGSRVQSRHNAVRHGRPAGAMMGT